MATGVMGNQGATSVESSNKSAYGDFLDLSAALYNVPDTQNGTEFVKKIARIHILAEKALAFKDENEPWKCRPELNKRRDAYDFDSELQHILCFVAPIGAYTADTIRCGRGGMHRTELKDRQGHIFHFVNRTTGNDSHYRKSYFAMNADIEHPQYAYFQYTFDNKTQHVSALAIIIPDTSGKSAKKFPINLNIARKELNHLQNSKSLAEAIESERCNQLAEVAQLNAISEADDLGKRTCIASCQKKKGVQS